MCSSSTERASPRQRYVTLGELVEGQRVIKEGLAPDDRLIVNGLMRARPGVKVNAQEQASPPTTASQSTTQ